MIHFHSFILVFFACVCFSLSLSLSKDLFALFFLLVSFVQGLFICFVLLLGVSPEFFEFCGVLRFFLLCFLSLERSTASFLVVDVLKI